MLNYTDNFSGVVPIGVNLMTSEEIIFMTYDEFIQNIINTRGQWNEDIRNEYCERHHIIPRCFGGLPENLTWDHHENIIWLTAKEHFIAHKLLAEEHPENYKIVYAWHMMWKINEYQHRYEPTAEEYEECRLFLHSCEVPESVKIHISEAKKDKGFIPWNKGKTGVQEAWNKGKKGLYHLSEEHKKNIGKSLIGRKFSEESRKKISQALKGKKRPPLSEEARKKIGAASKGRVSPMKGKPAWNRGLHMSYSQESLKKISKAKSDYNAKSHWFNDGTVEKFCENCPAGFKPGRLKRTKKDAL